MPLSAAMLAAFNRLERLAVPDANEQFTPEGDYTEPSRTTRFGQHINGDLLRFGREIKAPPAFTWDPEFEAKFYNGPA